MKKILFCSIVIFLFTFDFSYAEDNVYLKTLRVNEVGIVPYFNREINEYYLMVGMDVENIDVFAEAENNENITITGNNSLKDGLNTIKIQVSSNKIKNDYYIYVTKTDNKNTANTNLATLAMEDAWLTPEYNNNTSFYRTEIASKYDALNLLAIPENISAKVEISGNDNLKMGKNTVVIKVTAQNGYSFRRYYIDVYKRNGVEDVKKEEEKKYNARRLSAIINNEKNNNKEDNRKIDANKKVVVIAVSLLIGIVILLVLLKKLRKE